MLNPIKKVFSQIIAGRLALAALAIIPLAVQAGTTNTFNFINTTVTTSSGVGVGPLNPANGATSISGANLTAGDMVVFDGVVIDVPGSGSDAWGSVDLNGSGYGGVVSATLGVLAETGTSSGNQCQLFLNGSGTSTQFGISQGSRTNRVRIELTCTRTGSTTNMSYVVKIDQGISGTFSGTLSGAGVNFANNTIALTFGANNATHQFIQTQPIIAVSAPTPATLTVAAGVQATFAATITQGYPLNTAQQWLSNGVPILNATNLTYTTSATTASYNGALYSIVVTNLFNPANVVNSAAATLTIRSAPGIVPFNFTATAISNSSQVNPLNPPVAIPGSMLLAGDTVVFDGLVAANGPLTGAGDGWASINLGAGGFEGVTAAKLGVLVRLGTGASQLYVNGAGPVLPNPTSSGALTNHAHIELYPSATGSTTNMGWLVEIDQNLTGTFLPAVTGTNLTFTNNTIPLSFAAYSVTGLITPLPVGPLLAFHQQLSSTNLVVGAFDQVVVTGDYLNMSNVVLTPTTPGLVYTSSDTNVVTVSSTGFLQAVGIGQATVTSMLSSLSASNTVSVIDPGGLVSVTLVVSNQMPLFSNQQAVVLGTFANATNVNLLKYGQPTFALNNTNIVTISSSGLITAIGPGAAVIYAINSGITSAPRQVTVNYPTNRFIFDSFGDGFWTIVNQGNSNTLVVSSTGASQATSTNTAFDQQYELLYNYQNSTFRIRNRATWQCIGAKPGNLVGTGVIPVTYTGTPSQQWYLVDAGNGCFRIVNSQYGLVLQTDNGNPASVTLGNASSSPFQNWSFVYQAHYPKKGCAGYEGDYAQFGLNWAYNYDDNTGVSLPAQFNFVPMIHDASWEPLSDVQSRSAGWRSQPQPAYLLTYNEPDNSAAGGGANMTTNQVIGLWPQLQALNVPLVSPATQNTFDSWDYNFFSLIANNHYRVDYTAVHLYVPPNAASLISDLQSAYTTWGRPVWLTEFSPVDWSGTKSWSEDDDYNFLAEFMWQAEGQDWLKRYAIFPFSGTNSASPWVDNGYSGTFFLANGSTLSPYGELYATWDADLTLDARTPYLIHNLATSFRLTATNTASTPLASTIYVRNATTEWGLLPAPTTNHWYIISLNDGRRLRDTSGTLNLGPFLATGSAVEWEFNGPDSSGYYFITNTAGHALNGSGAAPAISFNTTTSSTQNNNTRWRLVKAYQPVSTSVSVPNNLSFYFTNQGVALSWSVDSNLYYNIYRSTASGGPYALIARVSSSTSYTDTAASSNSVPWYYVITGLNAFGDESGYSTQAAATVAAVWRQQWFGTTVNAGNAADTADPAQDGIINILKRAFNLNPTVAETSGTPYGTLNGNTFTLTYRKSLAATDLIFQVVSSYDLINWSTNNITDVVVSSDGVTEIHGASVPVDSATQFLQLKLTEP